MLIMSLVSHGLDCPLKGIHRNNSYYLGIVCYTILVIAES